MGPVDSVCAQHGPQARSARGSRARRIVRGAVSRACVRIATTMGFCAGVAVVAAHQPVGLGIGLVACAVAAAALGRSTRVAWPIRWLSLLCGVWLFIAVGTAGPTAAWLPSTTAASWLVGLVGRSGVRRPRPGRIWLTSVAVGLVWTLSALWTVAGDPGADWFGAVVSHGPRTSTMVALTFDDGPNDSATIAIADLLAARGVRGSFFLIGTAAEARPDLVGALVARGELVGDHSYRHATNDWLDPGYPEAQRGQRSIARIAGHCPTLFRPPHGRHSPFTAAAVHAAAMRSVTWDVSAHDWDTNDPALIARRVLDRVRGGSIVLLHDGANGDPTADRTVLVRALPAILDGLAARGLEPVGLDQLLSVAPWATGCTAAAT